MFEFDWATIGVAFLGVTVGTIMRYVVPYLRAALEHYGDTGKWLKFDRKYVAAFGLTILGYLVALLAEGFLDLLSTMSFWAALVFGFGSGDAVRKALRIIGTLVGRTDKA